MWKIAQSISKRITCTRNLHWSPEGPVGVKYSELFDSGLERRCGDLGRFETLSELTENTKNTYDFTKIISKACTESQKFTLISVECLYNSILAKCN